MPDATVTNPLGANRQVSDWTTWVDGAGLELNFDTEIATFRANAPVNRCDSLTFVVPTTTTPLSVTPSSNASSTLISLSFAGVALEAGPAGAMIRICTRGYCRANVGTATPAAFDVATSGQTAALGVGASVAIVATTLIGLVYGIFLGPKDANNFAPIRLGRF